VIDDLIVYFMHEDWFRIVVNAGTADKDVAWMERQRAAHAPNLTIQPRRDLAMIAVQGPNARDKVWQALPAVRAATESLKPFQAAECAQYFIGRTGYTGEDGGELFFPEGRALELWELLLAEGARLGIETAPIGLAARDSLRFEAGMPLHGHEISPSVDPIEAGFKWACDFEKDFVGKAALEAIVAAGPARKLACLDVTGGVPREGCEVLAPTGERVGACVAGMYCPTVKKYAANAFVDAPLAKAGTALAVKIRDRPRDAVVVKRPLYVPAYRR
jgi:aminomethyltransferase